MILVVLLVSKGLQDHKDLREIRVIPDQLDHKEK
jgi:hypothetical protein